MIIGQFVPKSTVWLPCARMNSTGAPGLRFATQAQMSTKPFSCLVATAIASSGQG
jgi:hypothetical protein